MSSYTLDDIRAAADRKYGSTDIQVGETTCRLVNPLRLTKAKRAELMAKQKELDVEDDELNDVDQEAILADCIRIVAENEHQANTLLGAIGGDLAVMSEVFSAYTEQQEAGEASASAD